jgi:hypothetical protein
MDLPVPILENEDLVLRIGESPPRNTSISPGSTIRPFAFLTGFF